MRILITGGAGFIGQHLAAALAPDHELVALDSLLEQVHADPQASVRRFPGHVEIADILDREAWERIGPCDAVVHLAAETGTGQSMYEVERYRRVNIDGTALAGEMAQAWSAPLVALSSRAVYGNGRFTCETHGVHFATPCCDLAVPAPSHEDDPHNPVSVYGDTKSEGEDVLVAIATQVPVTIIRPQNVVGPGQALHNPYTGVLAAFLARLREGQPLLVYGDGTATRDFIHVADVAALIAWCIANPPQLGDPRIVNAGTGTRTNLDELADAARAGAPGEPVPIEHVAVHRAGDIDHACADLTRLDALGAPRAAWSSRDAIIDFIRSSWQTPGAPSATWDVALDELKARGLTS